MGWIPSTRKQAAASWLRGAVMAAVVAALAGCAEGGDNPEAQAIDLALTNVDVIDVTNGGIAEDSTILIDDGSIVAIMPSGSSELYTAAQTIDQTGKFAVPGLWDMHVHLRGGEGLAAENAVFLSHFQGFGITAVRDAAGDLPEDVANWKRQIETGAMTGPRIFTSLRKIDGPSPTWEGSIAVDQLADIEPVLDQLAAAGPDFIKVYTSTLKPELYIPLLQAIEARGLQSAAHLPFAVPFRDAVRAGLDSVEHALYLHKAASVEDEAISAELLAGTAAGNIFGRLLDSYDENHFRETLAIMKEQGTALTPTLYVDHLLRFLDQNDYSQDERLALMSPAFLATYQRRIDAAARRTADRIAADHQRMTTTLSLMPAVSQAGVTILAGSDTGAYNSYVYPGDSLHHEMRLLQEAGLSPLAVLQAATISAARFMEKDDMFGSIAAGKAADILLLDENPLDNINHTRAIHGLVRGGTYFDTTMLSRLRAQKPPGD